MKNTFKPFLFFLLLGSVFVFHSCVDQDFDEPPGDGAALDITPNTNIAALKALYNGGSITEITDDLIIEAVVTADDESGNFYKKMVIEDETGGIEVLLNFTDAYNDYPVGRQVYIYCQGLYLDVYNDVTQLGGGIYQDNGSDRLDGVEENLAPSIILGGLRNQFVTPKLMNISEANLGDLSRLVTFESTQFIDGEIGLPYADAINLFSVNRNIEQCNDGGMILRSSGYADFASDIIPAGNGSVTGILSAFGGDYQLFIRNVNDVNMADTRCDGSSGGGGTGNEVRVDISQLRDEFNGGASAAGSEVKIQGTVISDRIFQNFQSRNLTIQDGSGGIIVRFSADHTFDMGDEVEIVVSGQELSVFPDPDGGLQVNNVPLGNATLISSGNSVTPNVITVADLLADFDNLESTLVEIQGATLTGGNTYEGGLDLTDATGTVTMWTQFGAFFAGDLAPTNGEEVTVVAVVGEYNEPQLSIRTTDDVTVTGGGGGGGGCDVDEDWTGGNDNNVIDALDWVTFDEEGTESWKYSSFSGDSYAQVSGFQSTSTDIKSWLITPAIDLSTPKTLNFNTIVGYWDHDPVTVWVSTDFDGSNVLGATWTQLNPILASGSDVTSGNFSDKVNSGDVSIPGSGTAHIAFVYEGSNDANNDTLFRVDDIQVCE